MNRLSLNGRWQAVCMPEQGASFPFEGRVPGSAIADLIRAGRLPEHIFYRKEADAVLPFERADYVYERTFSFEGDAHAATLVFERIDTYAEVYLNGVLVHQSENGNIRHEIPVADTLRTGENVLRVTLSSPVRRTEGLPARPAAFTAERLYTRRMQCTYGWDWVGRFVTVGLGDCALVTYGADEPILQDVYLATMNADARLAQVRADVTFAAAYRGRVFTVTLLDPDGRTAVCVRRYAEEEFLRIDLDVPSPALWYPRGYGEQPLYTFVLSDGEQELYRERIGLRTVRILQRPDAEGSPAARACAEFKNAVYDKNDTSSEFILSVNGRDIFCLGANWVPCVPFADGSTDERVTELLELCAEGGVNMLRIWGGGAFESRHFYEECSRLGITVTQDFLMACGHYPEEDPTFLAHLQSEAAYAARLMRNQPCLMWWSGDNENAVDGCDTDTDYPGRRSAYLGIAPVLYRLDPYRRFLPSSPYGGATYASNTVGTTHNTQYLGSLIFPFIDRGDGTRYKEMAKHIRARFIAEEPQLGAASLPSLRRFMTDEDIFEDTDVWLYHTKGNPALSKELFTYMTDASDMVLGKPTDGADRLFRWRYLQYEWLRLVTEGALREVGVCSGIIFWMMNDCWPAAAGWSLIDFFGVPKDAFYALRRLSRPVIATVDRTEDGRYRFYAVSRRGGAEQVRATVYRITREGTLADQIAAWGGRIAEGERVCLYETDLPLAEGELFVLDLGADGQADRSFWRDGALPLYRTEGLTLTHDEAACTVTVRADRYIHAVTLTAEAVFEDNAFSLLPNESRTLRYRPLAEDLTVTAEAYTLPV